MSSALIAGNGAETRPPTIVEHLRTHLCHKSYSLGISSNSDTGDYCLKRHFFEQNGIFIPSP